MYGQGKGISKSSMPYKKVPPRWLDIDPSEVTKQIEQLAKKGFKPSQIGVILRDNYAVPQSRLITGAKILRVLKKKRFSSRNSRRSLSFNEKSCCYEKTY